MTPTLSPSQSSSSASVKDESSDNWADDDENRSLIFKDGAKPWTRVVKVSGNVDIVLEQHDLNIDKSHLSYVGQTESRLESPSYRIWFEKSAWLKTAKSL